MKIRCLIVEDEPIARQIVEGYCLLLPELELSGSCSNALEAKQIIQSSQIDLIFLDINMPVLDGLAFLKTLSNPPQVIFTTAYKEYAYQAFDLAACDYLLKPFSFERFIIAVDKVKKHLYSINSKLQNTSVTETHAFIKSEGKIHKINFKEICFAEANGNHVKIVTDKGIINPTTTLAIIEELLPKSMFFRLHRSFIINKSKISHIEGNMVSVGPALIPIGSNYRDSFFREIGVNKSQ